MQLYPTFYFRPLEQAISLSYFFKITLRNPTLEELPTFEISLRNLSSRLSDKERRRILYTLYPLGNFKTQGTLEEQFVKELSKIWVIAYTDQTLPFEKGLVDYGFLCGYISDNTTLRNPGGFVCDITTLSPRELLRALKKELPKAASHILNPSVSIPDIDLLVSHASYWDGLFAQSHFKEHYVVLAQTLRQARDSKNPLQTLLHYCIVAEILLVHNPSKSDSKMPMNRQFISKLTLVRHMMIKLNTQHHIIPLETLQQTFTDLYELRSQITHGRYYGTLPKKRVAQYINILYPTVRLCMELQATDPSFMEFIKKI